MLSQFHVFIWLVGSDQVWHNKKISRNIYKHVKSEGLSLLDLIFSDVLLFHILVHIPLLHFASKILVSPLVHNLWV